VIRLGVDGRELRPGVRTGIGRYLLEVLRAVSRAGWPCIVYGDAGASLDDALAGIVFRALCAPSTQWWDQMSLPRALARDRVSVFLSPYYKAPLRAPCPAVITIHDLYFIGYPGRCRPLYDAALTRLARLYAARAAAVVTDSEYSKRAIVTRLGVDSAKVSVIPVALGPEFRPVAPASAAAARYGLTAPYILHVGNFMPHKNLARLIRAFAQLPDAQRGRHTLVLAGGSRDGRPALARLASELSVADRVAFPGRIDDEDLPALYAGAAVYVSPSLEEGFGSTVLEAMACGAPVAVANRAALPEVVADAGLLFDPEREHEMAATLARVLSDPSLAADLRRRARARAELFTPDRTSGRVLDVLQAVERQDAHSLRASPETR
jgi:glycosyltransferase involved in cell wall biosynthesis